MALKRFPATDIFLFRPSRVITGMDDQVYKVRAGYYGGPEAVKDEVRTSLTRHCQRRTKQSSATAKKEAQHRRNVCFYYIAQVGGAPGRLPAATLQSCSVITVNIMLSGLSYSCFIEGRSCWLLTLGAPLKGLYILLLPLVGGAAYIWAHIC